MQNDCTLAIDTNKGNNLESGPSTNLNSARTKFPSFCTASFPQSGASNRASLTSRQHSSEQINSNNPTSEKKVENEKPKKSKSKEKQDETKKTGRKQPKAPYQITQRRETASSLLEQVSSRQSGPKRNKQKSKKSTSSQSYSSRQTTTEEVVSVKHHY